MSEFLLLRTLANEGLKRSIFGLGSGSANSGNSDGGSPTCTVGTRTTRINSRGSRTPSWSSRCGPARRRRMPGSYR